MGEIARVNAVRQEIAKAETIEEQTDLLAKVKALAPYIKQIGSTLEEQNTLAEARLVLERKLGATLAEVERGSGPGRGKKNTQPGASFTQVLEEHSIARETARRWQIEATVPNDKFEEWIADQQAKEKEITSAAFLRFAQGPHVKQNSHENEWYTPSQYIEAARQVMGSIDLDPASCEMANQIVQATAFYDMETNGLSQDWEGNIWLNPPYSADLVGEFAKKLIDEGICGRLNQAVVLVNNATETAWAQLLLKQATAACFPKGRIKYLNKEGKPAKTPLQGQMFLYFGDNPHVFCSVFGEFGATLEVV